MSNQGANRRSAVPAGQPHRGRDWVSGPNHRGTDNGRALPARACGVLKPIAEKIIIVVSYHAFAPCPTGIGRAGQGVPSCGKKITCGAYVFTRMICELARSKDLVPCHRLIMGVSSLDFKPRFGGVFLLASIRPARPGRGAAAEVALCLSMKSGPRGRRPAGVPSSSAIKMGQSNLVPPSVLATPPCRYISTSRSGTGTASNGRTCSPTTSTSCIASPRGLEFTGPRIKGRRRPPSRTTISRATSAAAPSPRGRSRAAATRSWRWSVGCGRDRQWPPRGPPRRQRRHHDPLRASDVSSTASAQNSLQA